MKCETEGPEKELSPKLCSVLISNATELCELLSDDKYDVFCDESVFFNERVVKSCSSILFSVSFIKELDLSYNFCGQFTLKLYCCGTRIID